MGKQIFTQTYEVTTREKYETQLKMQGNTHYPLPHEKDHIFQEILPPSPLNKKLPNYRMIALAQRRR